MILWGSRRSEFASVVCAVVDIVVWGSSWVRQLELVAFRHAATFNSSDAGKGPSPGEPSWSTVNNVPCCCCCCSCCCLSWSWWRCWTLCSPTTRFVWCCSLICICAACSCCWRNASCSIWSKSTMYAKIIWCQYEQKIQCSSSQLSAAYCHFGWLVGWW